VAGRKRRLGAGNAMRTEAIATGVPNGTQERGNFKSDVTLESLMGVMAELQPGKSATTGK
jgi:hypothetical protein